jgi:hypothetical protein
MIIFRRKNKKEKTCRKIFVHVEAERRSPTPTVGRQPGRRASGVRSDSEA